MLIIGITGQPSSGKDTIAEHLSAQGFAIISTSDLIRQEMRKFGLPTGRAHMHDFVNEMRKARGPDYLAVEVIKTITGDTASVGLRNIAEVSAFRKAFGKQFVLVATEALLDIRYARAQERRREGDHISLEQFKAEEEVERHGSAETQQVDDVIAMADYTLKNDGFKEDFLHSVDDLLAKLRTRII